MKDKYQIIPIDRSQYFEWIVKRHYAKTMPSVSFAFGLFDIKDSNNLVGVCTFGLPCRNLNDGYACFGPEYPIKTWELNRLIVEEGLPKNSLSYFVSQSLKQMKTPCCIVSYADENNGHHGYIYQATNWMYVGKSKPERMFINTITNRSNDVRRIDFFHFFITVAATVAFLPLGMFAKIGKDEPAQAAFRFTVVDHSMKFIEFPPFLLH